MGLGALGLGGNKENSDPPAPAHRAQPTILQLSSPNQGVGLSHLLFAGALGAGAVMVLGGLQWMRRDDPAERLRPQLENLERSALKQVRKADDNSAHRDRQLDANNKQRLKKVSAEIRGESRANFDVLSQQIHTLTQIALQTLTTMAKPTVTGATPGGEGIDQETIERERQKILNWSRKAQSESDKFMDVNQVSKARRYHVSSLRAEIPGLRETPGGGERKEEAPIQAGPHKLPNVRPRKKKKKRGMWTMGMGCLGCGVIAGSVYMMGSSSKPGPEPPKGRRR